MPKIRLSSKKNLFIIAGCVAVIAVVKGFLSVPSKVSISSNNSAYLVLSDTLKSRKGTIEEVIARNRAAGKKPTRLINEKSPYLLQHPFNPVDWYPWSEEAFEKARKENKLIFFSVGYSTGYWCHV